MIERLTLGRKKKKERKETENKVGKPKKRAPTSLLSRTKITLKKQTLQRSHLPRGLDSSEKKTVSI